ncbi:diguanylate cyclase [Roseovarius sp. SCSIO 43702]|uniref:GGDEF domain-containing response regulator n=1 Tax=Roseovarius sp. SCSIO 43702 TaxID=2823043 RepID=UPI001C72B6EC|nr:diguanylate cyclase [Roseovarius sp. SCSIO 43702]QYX57922.1 diguanylate cyclase [Roseovarius sp. SCSIO 43702]
MPGKILIADPVATNRIILKVKLSAGHFDVSQAGTAADTMRLARDISPDLILISNALPDRDAAGLIDALRARPDLPDIPIAVLLDGGADAAADADLRARLLARADAVITRPFHDALLLARLRGLLFRRNSLRDLRQQATTGTAGFAEEPAALDRPGHIALVAPEGAPGSILMRGLEGRLSHRLRLVDATRPFPALSRAPRPDALLLHLADLPHGDALRLLAELRAAPDTRQAAVLALLDTEDEETAAQLLDAGLDDVMLGPVAPDHIALRLDRLVRQAQTAHVLRTRLRDGLRASITDPLTGLYNRRFALPFLQRLCEGRTDDRGGPPFAVMLADLDHFKRINDRYGHAAGDEVLAQVSDLLLGSLRHEDVVARIGGEEFLVICPGLEASAARMAADRLCRRVAEIPMRVTGEPQSVPVTISVGVVMGGARTGAAGGAEALLAQADRALYASKAQGRNTVTFQSTRPAA